MHAIPERLQDLHRLIVRSGVLDDVLETQAPLTDHGLDAVRDEPAISK
jgi:hypothetical protein